MQTQNYKSHSRYVPLFHIVTSLAIIICIAASAWDLCRAFNTGGNRLNSATLLLLSLSCLSLFWYTREFPVKVQDRAIRAEENLRHFALTGKLLDKRITMRQVIALRFADDAEFVSLAQKAADENLTSNQIKSEIKNWRADHHRA
jgi:hypothetical protein